MKRFPTSVAVIFASALFIVPCAATAQPALVIKPLAEKKVTELPPGPLVWRLENFSALAQAQAPAGGASPGGIKVAEIGPIPKVVAAQYLLRINEASGPPGSITPVHTHPGS